MDDEDGTMEPGTGEIFSLYRGFVSSKTWINEFWGENNQNVPYIAGIGEN